MFGEGGMNSGGKGGSSLLIVLCARIYVSDVKRRGFLLLYV